MLGVYAVISMSIGSVLPLIAIRRSAEARYEQYLFNRLRRLPDFLPFLAPLARQLAVWRLGTAYLRRMLAAGFGVAEIHATLMAICVCVHAPVRCNERKIPILHPGSAVCPRHRSRRI